MDNLNVIALIVSLVAVGVAFWQGFLAKSQLEEAKRTKNETEKLLDEIKSKVHRVETISDETRKDVKEQISKLIDQQDQNLKVLLNAPKESSQNEMLMTFLPKLFENPELMEKLIKFGDKQK